MKELITFIIESITGSDDFIVEERLEGDRVEIDVSASKDIIGLIIGKQGKTIKTIRKIASIKAALSNKTININVNEK